MKYNTQTGIWFLYCSKVNITNPVRMKTSQSSSLILII